VGFLVAGGGLDLSLALGVTLAGLPVVGTGCDLMLAVFSGVDRLSGSGVISTA
jgi:hypothetical protein